MLKIEQVLKSAGRVAVAVAAVSCLWISTASAQPPGGGQRGGFQGGMGGGMGGGPMGLLMMPEVQTELKITDDQKTKFRETMQGMREGMGNLRDMSREEREKAMTEQTKKMTDSVKSILTPEQFTRLEQLQVQRAGVEALMIPSVAEKLALTADQKTKLEEIRTASRPNIEGMRDMSREERTKMMEEMRTKRTEAQAKMMEVLTAEQKTKLEELKGASFTFPENPGFGGRGGAPGQPGQRGQGRPGGNRPAPAAAPADDL